MCITCPGLTYFITGSWKLLSFTHFSFLTPRFWQSIVFHPQAQFFFPFGFFCCHFTLQFSCSVVSDSATPWTPIHQASLSITNSQSLLKLMSIISVMPSNHLILCRPLLLPPLIFPSIRVFSNESVLHIRWSKCWSLSFSISPSNGHSGVISFRIDWFHVLAVQGTLKSFL